MVCVIVDTVVFPRLPSEQSVIEALDPGEDDKLLELAEDDGGDGDTLYSTKKISRSTFCALSLSFAFLATGVDDLLVGGLA